MKHPRPSKKLIFAILLLVLLTWLFAVVLTAASTIVYTAYNLDQRVSQMKALCDSVKKEFALYDTVIADAMKRNMIMNSLDFAGQATRTSAPSKSCSPSACLKSESRSPRFSADRPIRGSYPWERVR